jgi:LAS superfamily LD-carboxypeptidase LdcB
LSFFQLPFQRAKTVFFLLSVVLGAGLWFIGCAAPEVQYEEPQIVSTSQAVPTPPALTEAHLLGLKMPPHLVQDPESQKYAIKEVMEAYWGLKEKAEQEGWHLILVSGYRSFWNQKAIWNDYMNTYYPSEEFAPEGRVLKTMSAVSIPGFTRHHWGTDLDISGKALQGRLVNIKPDTPKNILRFYSWMEKNAPTFGFCRVYRGNRGIVKDEPWHWSYYGFARDYQKQFLQIQDYSVIFKKRVNEIEYIAGNFEKIFRHVKEAVESDCKW